MAASAITGLIAVLALVSLPLEVTIGLVDHPVVAPGARRRSCSSAPASCS